MGGVRHTGQPSWRLSVSSPFGLYIGLYVREAAGLRPPAAVDLPALDPPVELRADLVALAVPAAAQQWAAWWDRELARQEGPERGFFSPDARFGDGAELDALVRACMPDAARWASAARDDRRPEPAPPGERDAAGRPRAGAYRTDDWSPPVPVGTESALVRTVEAELGRKARAFDLTITQLPLAAPVGWRPSPHHLLVSRALRADPAAYRAWLTPILREVA
jgi:hypothetical protein